MDDGTVGRGTRDLGENNGKDDGVGKLASGFEMNVGLVWYRLLASLANNGEISQPKPPVKRSED